MTAEEFLLSLMPTEEMIDRFVDPTVYIEDQIQNNRGRTFHPELGFIVKDTILNDAMHGGKSKVTFQSDGARSQVNFPDQTPRISSFGNSFTMCNQVNDAGCSMDIEISKFSILPLSFSLPAWTGK